MSASYNAYEAFGHAAECLTSPLLIAGRYVFQDEAESLIIKDVLHKLRPKKADHLLEIGCGVGGLLRPLSRYFAYAIGIDHPSCIHKFRELGLPYNVKLIAGQWPETKVKGDFDCILVYSVLQYLPDAQTARYFIGECINVLKPGGRLLLGDIPNKNSRQRFLSSDFGKRFSVRWGKLTSRSRLNNEHALRDEIFSHTKKHPSYLSDRFILQLLLDIRRKGLESYVMPQPANLPFAYSREDILIRRRN